jgi:hypothetical protein
MPVGNNAMYILAALVVLGVLVAILIPMGGSSTAAATEGFLDPPSAERAAYIQTGQDRYNRFSDSADITRRTAFVGLSAEERRTRNRDLALATDTSVLRNTVGTPTGVGIEGTTARLRVAPPSQILEQASKCETLKGREACGAAGKGEYANCGVCIKGGTPYTKPEEAGRFIGGMLILPDDREDAEENGAASANGVVYAPSIGECPAGSFFLGGETCVKEANRADCKEVGETGGFGGQTAEGRRVGDAKCATIPTAGGPFIYDPKNRTFDLFLRVLPPKGSGINRVEVKRGGKRVAFVDNVRESDGTLQVRIPNAKEGENYSVVVVQEAPFRKAVAGKEEVFLYAANPSGTNAGYNMTQSVAQSVCERIGARQATMAELEDAQHYGAQQCRTGWTTDASNAAFPMQQSGVAGCGNAGVNRWSAPDPSNPSNKMGNAWCMGVKPPQSTNQQGLFTQVFEWATGLGDVGAAQRPVTKGSKFSTVNEDGTIEEYQAPFYRGIVAQLESGDFRTTVPVDKFITGVNGVLKTSSGDIRTLRRFGTFAASKLIDSPKPADLPTGSSVQPGAYWFWSNQAESQTMTFSFVVPGTFLPPVYGEDAAVVGTQPLVTKASTLSLFGAEPCDGGITSSACLRALFVAAGGDIYAGTLARGDFSELRTTIANGGGGGTAWTSRDDVEGYLANLASLATRGRGLDGARVGAAAINQASKQLYGFELVSPCEDIREDERGNVVLVPKAGPYDADCLNWLWNNTGNDRDRGNSDLMRRTRIRNTYTSIADRYSGLRSREGTEADRAAAPFRTCTPAGTLAPKNAAGAKNIEAIKAANAKGSIESIQDFYDSVHKTANYRGGAAESREAHTTALQQCYGITRSGPPAVSEAPPTCTPKARYVRVLASTLQPVNGDVAIQIPQLEVFDVSGREVAKGKPTSASSQWDGASGPSLAVDGQNWPQPHGAGEFHNRGATASREFWMVDLGADVEIGRVIYYPRTDCCTNRQYGAPVQLLNASKQIVAQKLIGSNNGPAGRWNAMTPESLSFSASDAKPFVMSSIAAGARISFQTATSFDRYLRHAGFQFFASGPDGYGRSYSGLMKNDASFVVRGAGGAGAGAGPFRFESVNFPNHFLKFRALDQRAILAPGGDASADMLVVPSTNGDPTMISIKHAGSGRFLATSPGDPTVIVFTTIDTSDPWDAQRGAIIPKIPSLAG